MSNPHIWDPCWDPCWDPYVSTFFCIETGIIKVHVEDLTLCTVYKEISNFSGSAAILDVPTLLQFAAELFHQGLVEPAA